MSTTEYVFDTSAINALADERDSDAIVSGIASTARAFVSSLSVVEAAATPDASRRVDLLRLQKTLAGSNRPLEDPRALVRRLMRAYANRDTLADISVGEENVDIWVALSDPESVDESVRNRIRGTLDGLKATFREVYDRARLIYQRVIEGGSPRPRSAGVMLRAFASSPDFLAEIIDRDYEGETGQSLTTEEVMSFLAAAPDVAGYYAGWGHAVYSRAIAQSAYGDRKNPGAIDLWFGAYLPRCGYFVTNDRPQYKAMRLVGVMVAPACQVLPYAVFRRRVLLGAL